MIHAASKQLKHVKAILYSQFKTTVCKKTFLHRDNVSGQQRSVLTQSSPLSDLFWFEVIQAQQSVILSISDHSVIKVYCIGTSYQETHGSFSSYGHVVIYEELFKGTITSCPCGTVCARAELFTAAS